MRLLWRHAVAAPSGHHSRSGLTVHRIVDTALAMADAQGLAALTMRRIGLHDVEMDAALAHLLALVRASVLAEMDAAEAEHASGTDAAGWWDTVAPLLAEVSTQTRTHAPLGSAPPPVARTKPPATRTMSTRSRAFSTRRSCRTCGPAALVTGDRHPSMQRLVLGVPPYCRASAPPRWLHRTARHGRRADDRRNARRPRPAAQ